MRSDEERHQQVASRLPGAQNRVGGMNLSISQQDARKSEKGQSRCNQSLEFSLRRRHSDDGTREEGQGVRTNTMSEQFLSWMVQNKF